VIAAFLVAGGFSMLIVLVAVWVVRNLERVLGAGESE
jgi:hypothetical protein